MRMVRRLVILTAFVLWLAALVMWPLSRRFSSIGFEREHRYGDTVINRWYGIVYPGNGGIMIGGKATFAPFRGQAIDAFDLGSTWLRPPFDDRTESSWERAGFVWRKRKHQVWVGVPAWLLVVLTGIAPVALLRRRWRRNRVTRQTDRGS